jgi:phosphocarrier protein
MGLLMLAASQGTTIDVETEGPQAKELADALEQLVKNRFDEAY